MDLQAFDQYLNNQRAPEAATTSLAGRDLPEDLVGQVSSLTMGQLFYILGHIQKLSAQAPVTAQALLAENPQICYALLHAECLAGMIEEPLLPMTSEELTRAKGKARRMREDLANHEIPPSEEQVVAQRQAATMMGGLSKHGQPAVPPWGVAPGGPPPSCGMPHFCKAAPPPPPPPPPMQAHPQQMAGASAGFAPGYLGDPNEAQRQSLMQKLVQLTPEQIAQLPEQTKVQLLTFLQQNSG